MSAFWVYTLARLGVLLAAFGVLYAAGARGLLLIVLAFVVSMLVSYWLLAGLRYRFTTGVQSRAARITERLDAATRAEDDDADLESRPEPLTPDDGVDAAGGSDPLDR